MRRRTKHRTLISMILAFFLAICFFLIMFSSEMLMGYMGKRNFKDSITESYYVENAINKMKADIGTLLETRAVPPELLKEVLDETICYVEIRNYIDATIEGRKLKVDATEFKVALEEKLYEYLEQNQIYETEGIRSTIDEIVIQSGKIYERNLQPEFIFEFFEFREQVQTPLIIIIIVALLLGTVIAILLWSLYHHKHRAVRHMMIALITALIWNILMTIMIGKAEVLSTLNIGPAMYVDFVKVYVNSGIGELWIMSAIAALLCIAMYSIIKYLKHNTRKYKVK